MTSNKPRGIGVLAAGGRVAAAQRAVAAMVTNGTGAVLPCPWDACPHIAWWTARIAENLTPAGYRLVLERPLEGELVRWRVQRIIGTSSTGLLGPTAIAGETVGHVVIGRESAAPSYDASMPDGVPFIPADGLVYLVVS